MYKILGKLFIKKQNYMDIENEKVRNTYGIIASLIGIICNLFLAIAKIIIGAITSALSVIADGINNLSDIASSSVSLVGFKLSEKPADKEHPFGHARIEYICTLAISFIILLVGAQLIFSSVERIIAKESTIFSYITLGILLSSVIVKLGLYILNIKLSKEINSTSLKGVAKDSLCDIITSSTIMVSIALSKSTGIVLDGYVGVLVAILIIIQGIFLMKDTLDPLLGAKPDSELVKKIAIKIESYEGIIGIHDLVIHNYGHNRYFVSVHAEVDANVPVMESHELIDNIEREINTPYLHLVIHMDPVVTDDQIVNSFKILINNCVNSIDDNITIHDFRMINGPNRKNLIFDIVLPINFKMKDNEIIKTLTDKVNKIDHTCLLIVNIDRNYNSI